MLELDTVNFSISGIPILRQVSLSVDACETLAILGASGSGKSTILKIILRLLTPDSGRVLLRGKNIAAVSYGELIELRKTMGIVFQDGALFDSLTVGENVGYYYMQHERLTHAQVEPQVVDMLKTVGLEHTINMMPEELSGGMRRRVAIARALIYKPALILYDEPTTGLDPVSRDSILELINHLKQDYKVASVIVTHNLDDAARVADRLLVIRAGEIIWRGTRKQFLAQNKEKIGQFFKIPEKETA